MFQPRLGWAGGRKGRAQTGILYTWLGIWLEVAGAGNLFLPPRLGFTPNVQTDLGLTPDLQAMVL